MSSTHARAVFSNAPHTMSSEDARREQRERASRELFVAMTRARDTLWIGRLAVR